MATSTYMSYADSSTLALFLAWAKPIADFLKASPCNTMLTQTADTGQVNWASLASPPSASTFVYEVYKFTDSYGTSLNPPMYLRVEYGSTSPVTGANMKFSFGTSTNGAGTLTGLLSSGFTTSGGSGSNIVQYPTYLASDGTYLTIALHNGWGNTTGAQEALFCMERTRNADNTVNGDGLYFFCPSVSNGLATSGGAMYQCFSWAAATPAWGGVATGMPIAGDTSFANWAIGSTVYTAPHIPMAPRPQQGQGTMLVGYRLADLVARSTFTQTVNGLQRVYLALGTSFPSGQCGSLINMGVAVRYD